jgi:hypothetical protein
MKRKLKEMEEEAARLRESQVLGGVTPSSACGGGERRRAASGALPPPQPVRNTPHPPHLSHTRPKKGKAAAGTDPEAEAAVKV